MNFSNVEFIGLALYKDNFGIGYECSIDEKFYKEFLTKIKFEENPSMITSSLKFDVGKLKLKNICKMCKKPQCELEKITSDTFSIILEGMIVDLKNDIGIPIFMTIDKIQLLSYNNWKKADDDIIIFNCILSVLKYSEIKMWERDIKDTIYTLFS